MPMPSKVVTLVDQTSGANASTTVVIDTSDYDALFVEAVFSGAASGTPNLLVYDADLSVAFAVSVVAATATYAFLATGLYGGVSGDSASSAVVRGAVPLPASCRVTVGAAGVGVTTRLVVKGRRKFKGPDHPPVVNGVPTGD